MLAIGCVFAIAAYELGPAVALGGFAAIVVAAAVFVHPMIGVYTAVLAVPMEFASAKFGSSFSLTPTKALMLLTGLAVGLRLLSAKRFPMHRAHVAFGAFLAIMALGIAVAVDTFVTERILVIWIAVWLASVWVAGADRTQVQRVMICIALSGAALGALALLGAGPQSLQQGGAVATNRATGSFTHPNQLGAYMVLALPVTIVLAAELRGWLRLVMVLSIGLDVAGLTLTLARAAIIGAGVAAVVLLLWPAYRRVMLTGIAVVALILVVNPKTIQTGEVQTLTARLSTVQNLSSSIGGRPLVWAATPRIIADHPLIGIGQGNFPIVSAAYGILDVGGGQFDHAHNVPLTIAAETGLLGLVAFLWFCGAIAIDGARTVIRGKGSTAKFALALMAAYAGTALMSLTDYPLTENADFSVIMVEAALLIALTRHASGSSQP